MNYTGSKIIVLILLLMLSGFGMAQRNVQDEFTEIHIDTLVTQVQPMTGIVFWQGQYTEVGAEAISMEFSYMRFNDVVVDSGIYNWDVVDEKLEDIASRRHQAIFRFWYVYPGHETTVPDYIKQMDDYHETEGISEGKTTWFPDWTYAELQRFTLEFYTKFAERYDNDPRLAFLEVGFGLWAEYHIYDGPFIPGVTFPSKEFQESFFYHMDTTFAYTPFMISIDAADDTYSPFEQEPELLDIHFGNFDDSFMHEDFDTPGEYNTESWKFFGSDRYRTSPAGGEFSYYTDYDQRHVLDWPDGPYGKPYEYFAAKYHITFIIGNDQPNYQSTARIKQASLASGYKFKIVSFKSKSDSSVVVVTNSGAAPVYYDAYITVNGMRSPQSLKLLSPGDTLVCSVSAGGENPVLTIESDRLVPGQSIGYLGTENFAGINEKMIQPKPFRIFPTVLPRGQVIHITRKVNSTAKTASVEIFTLNGHLAQTIKTFDNELIINTDTFSHGVYFVRIRDNKVPVQTQKIIIQ